MAAGPLAGVRVLEFEGIGPAPFCAMQLADHGAAVVRVARPVPEDLLGLPADPLARGRAAVHALDLKTPAGREAALALVAEADVLVEGFRPGVMERLGLGPDQAWARNPALVYGRVTGWGQAGPLAAAPGHDVTYLALSGALDAIGTEAGGPVVPLNLVGDFGGGGLLLAFGVLAALVEARATGRGRVVDAAMLDGAALQATMVHALRRGGRWAGGRGANLLDGGYPLYATYRCADGLWVAVGALEARFAAALLAGLGIDPAEYPAPVPPGRWPALRARLEAAFAARPRAAWCALLEGTDACLAPVLGLDEAPAHPHAVARAAFADGLPAPAPRFGAPFPGDPRA